MELITPQTVYHQTGLWLWHGVPPAEPILLPVPLPPPPLTSTRPWLMLEWLALAVLATSLLLMISVADSAVEEPVPEVSARAVLPSPPPFPVSEPVISEPLRARAPLKASAKPRPRRSASSPLAIHGVLTPPVGY